MDFRAFVSSWTQETSGTLVNIEILRLNGLKSFMDFMDTRYRNSQVLKIQVLKIIKIQGQGLQRLQGLMELKGIQGLREAAKKIFFERPVH